MADKSKRNEPELLPPMKQDDESRALREVQSLPSSVAPFSTPSKIPFVNRFRKKSIDTYNEVIDAETNLFHSLGRHALTKGRLRDIDIEIETEHIERENKLRDAQRTAKIADQQDELSDLDIKAQIAEKKKRLNEINKEAEPPPPSKSPAEIREEELKEDAARRKHKLDKDMLNQKDKINRLLRIDDEKKKMIAEITDRYLQEHNVKRVTQLPPEVIQELDDKIEDIEGIFDDAKTES